VEALGPPATQIRDTSKAWLFAPACIGRRVLPQNQQDLIFRGGRGVIVGERTVLGLQFRPTKQSVTNAMAGVALRLPPE
jgi:hypothetical protein